MSIWCHSLSLSLSTLNLSLKLEVEEVEELYNAGSVITLVGELITPALSLQLSASSHHRMASKTVLLVLGLLLPLITTRVSSADNEEKLILKAPYAKIPTPAPVKAPAPATVPVKAPPTPAPVTKTPPPLPPVTKPPPTLPPVPKPLPPPLPPVAKPPPTVPPVTPPASPPLPPVRSKADCIPLCDQRCKLHSRKNVCTRACMTCCDRCKCVPPGTYGNRERCGKCYTDMTTHGNRIKCP